jgi:hypothetical protein
VLSDSLSDKPTGREALAVGEAYLTSKKTTEYNVGSVVSVSGAYDEPLPTNQFPMPNQPRKKVVDVTIQCNGESRKFTIPENKSVITDTNLGLTISTDKQEIVNILRN